MTELQISAGKCKKQETVGLIRDRRYVDNLNDSFRTPADYFAVRKELIDVHQDIHLPIKECLTTKAVDPNLLSDRGRNDPIIITLGLKWDVSEDTLSPHIYLTRFPTQRGKSLGVQLGDDWSLEAAHVTRLVLSRIVPQLIEALGGRVKAQGQMLLSWGCQIPSTSQMKTPFVELDKEFGQQAFEWLLLLKKL